MAPRLSYALALFPATKAFKSMQNSSLAGKDPNDILCPVLAALYNNGALKADEYGDSERAEIKSALKDGIKCSEDLSEFQSAGIAGYNWVHKQDQQSRDRCLPGLTLSGTACWNKWLVGSTAKDVKRYLNIFNMDGLETVEHGFSTGVRGGNCNSPAENDPCDGQYPCEALFQKYYVNNADSNGRIYRENILQIVCDAMAHGDRSGEFSYQDGDVSVLGLTLGTLPARQWQMKAAMQGWLSAFGREDSNGKLYFTIDDARAMMMEGRVPDGWTGRRWGCVTSLGGCPTLPDGSRDMSIVEQATTPLPCDESQSWWEPEFEQLPKTITGQSCRKDGDCGDRELCFSRRCTCGKGRNGQGMLFSGGSCVEAKLPRMWNGRQCRSVRADNPWSPSVWSSDVIV